MDEQIQVWELTTFNQTVISIGDESVNKTIVELMDDDSNWQIRNCGIGQNKWLYNATMLSGPVEIDLSTDAKRKGGIIGGTHPTCNE